MINQKVNWIDQFIPNNMSLKFPKLAQFYDFDEAEESDYQDQQSIKVGKYSFKPNWTNLNFMANLENNENINCFCPICGKYVNKIQKNYQCSVQKTNKKCFAHKQCIDKNKNAQKQLVYTKSLYSVCKGYINDSRHNFCVGGKEYLLSVNLSHELGNVSYLKLQRKMIDQQGVILLNFENQKQICCLYDPNVALIPSPHFKIQLSLKQFGSSQNAAFNDILSLDLTEIYMGIKNFQSQSTWVIKSEQNMNWIINFEIQIIFDKQIKRNIMDIMNYKYPHSIIDNLPFIKINKIFCQEKKIYNEGKQLKIQIDRTNACSLSSQIIEEDSNMNKCIFSMRFSDCIQIQTDIISYSKTQGGSKVLQKKIKQMNIQQLDQFVTEIIPHLQDLLTDDYANYMIQTLISVSNQQQKLIIFNNILKIIPQLVCSKQGTFALQQIIQYVQTHQQFIFFSKIANQSFVRIAKDINGNHFLRKLLNKLPFRYIEVLFETIFHNFLQLVNHKNSVCVLKILLKVIAKQCQTQEILCIRKKIIQFLFLNRQKILRDEFGNYLIQEAFQNFGHIQMKNLSQYIFNKFKFLSKEKFSSNIICKCISFYWKRTDYYKKIDEKLNKNDILDLFFNKQGNKVLLELISSKQNEQRFTKRIIKIIQNQLPSKYNTKKWQINFGNEQEIHNQHSYKYSKTYKNGINSRFSQKNKKKNNYNIHLN